MRIIDDRRLGTGVRVAPLLAIIAAAVCAGCVGPFSETFERQFADAKSARAADPSRWIPDILPDDATHIHEVHEIDTNETWGCFKTQRADAVRSALSQLKATPAQGPIHAGPKELFRDFSWWPESMRSSSRIEAWQFVEPGGVVRVGIDAGNGIVCFHRAR